MDTSAIIFYISHISLLMHHHLKDAKVTLTRKTMLRLFSIEYKLY